MNNKSCYNCKYRRGMYCYRYPNPSRLLARGYLGCGEHEYNNDDWSKTWQKRIKFY